MHLPLIVLCEPTVMDFTVVVNSVVKQPMLFLFQVLQNCSDIGSVNPKKCVYMKEWLE